MLCGSRLRTSGARQVELVLALMIRHKIEVIQ
jgi:hypothetical protein